MPSIAIFAYQNQILLIMKLAEALTVRADYQKRIEQMSGRLQSNVKVQEGDAPSEAPGELLSELEDLISKTEDIVFRINKTNMLTKLSDGETLTRKIAHRDALSTKVRKYQEVLDYLQEQPERYSRNEIKYVKTISVGDLRQILNAASKELREIDVAIQGANWTIELLD